MELILPYIAVLVSALSLAVAMTTEVTTTQPAGTQTMSQTTNGMNSSSNGSTAQVTVYQTTDSSNMSDTTVDAGITTTTRPMNCSYPGQECQNGTCSTPAGSCTCFKDYTGSLCETYMGCQEDYCFPNGTENCTLVGKERNMYCTCKRGYYGNHCEFIDGCKSSPCQNNGSCVWVDPDGGYRCECLTGDPTQNCGLNDQNDCHKNPPNSIASYITCVDLIGGRNLYCAPGYNGTSCLDVVPDDDYCLRHRCMDSTYCKPLCNVQKCNQTDICGGFTANVNLTSTQLFDLTECSIKFANGYQNTECTDEDGLFDGFDGIREGIKDCSPFFDTICTRIFSDGICNPECNNTDCMYDGGDCVQPGVNGSDTLPGLTVIRFSHQSMYSRRNETATRLSMFVRAKVQLQFSKDGLHAGMKIMGSKFSDIAIASKFFAVAIGKVPQLLDMVSDVYACKHGMYTNGSESVCDRNCSSTCDQSGEICNWSGGVCFRCQDNLWGEQCENTCHVGCNGTCMRNDGRCIFCPAGKYGASCEMSCDANCASSECDIRTGKCQCSTGYYWSNDHCKACSMNCKGGSCSMTGLCTMGCMPGYYGDRCMKHCSKNCKGGSCSVTGQCTQGCMTGYYGNSCRQSCMKNCKEGSCLVTGKCTGDCMSGYYGDMCDQMCPTGCAECLKNTGECVSCNPGASGCHIPLVDDEEENNTGVIIAIVIAILIVLLIIIIAICCWRRKQSGDYILEDEEMECPVDKAETLDVKNNLCLQPVSPYMGRSTDMIDMDEKQQLTTGVYSGPGPDSKADMMDRNPDGKSTSSDEGKSKVGSPADENTPDPEDKMSDPEDDTPATGVGAPLGRKMSSLKITLSREKQPDGEMSPKSPQLIVVNDKTGQILSPLKIDYPEGSAFVMPETSLKHTMAPLASEEDLLSGVGPKDTPATGEDDENIPPPIENLGPVPDDEEDKKSKRSSSSSSKRSSSSSEGKKSKRSSVSSEGKKSNRSSKTSEGKKSNKSRSSHNSSSSSGSEDEELAQYDENKDQITEM